jgi:hypothetical protein
MSTRPGELTLDAVAVELDPAIKAAAAQADSG